MSGFRTALCVWAMFRCCSACVAGPDATVLEITKDTQLEPGRVYSRIVIKASNIAVDGCGAWVVGATGTAANERKGTGVTAENVSNVTLRNLNVRGCETGIRVSGASGWLIENCNASDNFHDPDFGWGENGRRGGIVLERVSHSTLKENKANRVWDGCVLVDSCDNRLLDNDFSHASNTCLKLWKSSRNAVEHNVLSYGLRIRPGEVHARDSACVLIETGSNDNTFRKNDCTHGGDGIFVRVLNGCVSTGNLFEENDVSFANNNGFEAWSPRNVYRRNRANHCSYGFWLGASDQTRLEQNEASFNGDPRGFHNSPHLPGGGHAGIVFMFGPSSHTVVRANVCRDNHGAGIALIGDLDSAGRKWKAYHWVIERNRLVGNRWGIYARFADWIDVAANTFENNTEGALYDAGGVTRLLQRPGEPDVQTPPRVTLTGPSEVKVGDPVVFDANASRDLQGRPLRFAWDLGDGASSTSSRVNHTFTSPGFRRLGLTVSNGVLADLAWRDVYVVDNAPEFGTEGQSAQWTCVDPTSRVAFHDDTEQHVQGLRSIRADVRPYGGGRTELEFSAERTGGLPVRGAAKLVFWIRAINENIPAWQGNNPTVTLFESKSRSVTLTPRRDLMSQRLNNEEREGWSRFEVPLAGDDTWERQGDRVGSIHRLRLGFDSWGTPPLSIWVDGLSLQ